MGKQHGCSWGFSFLKFLGSSLHQEGLTLRFARGLTLPHVQAKTPSPSALGDFVRSGISPSPF
jgi:hypothetical protein